MDGSKLVKQKLNNYTLDTYIAKQKGSKQKQFIFNC